MKALSQLARTSKGVKTLLANVLADAKVVALLQHVAFGEQEQAERILKINPTLLLEKGRVTDYSGRTFEGITAFQYAAWALDRHMWRMILKYLPREEATKQLYDHIYNKKAYKDMHGDYYDFVPLIDALQSYVTHFNNWTDDQRIKQWYEVVDVTQQFVPAHVANEYCRDDRSFYPTPKFKEDNLPRALILYNFSISANEHWFRAGAGGRSARCGGRWHGGVWARERVWEAELAAGDLAAMTALCKVRTHELLELKQQLLPNPAQAPEELNPVPERPSCVIS